MLKYYLSEHALAAATLHPGNEKAMELQVTYSLNYELHA